MSSTAEQLNKIVERTERLIQLCNVLQEENDLLKLDNEALTVAFNASKKKTKELDDIGILFCLSNMTRSNKSSNQRRSCNTKAIYNHH